MDKELSLLLKVQSVDLQISSIAKEKKKAPEEIEKIKEHLGLLKKTIDQELSTLTELKKSRIKVEKKLDEIEIKRNKSKIKLNDVKSNKEYQAVLTELEEMKELTSKNEEIALDRMEEIEIKEKEHAENNISYEKALKAFDIKEIEFRKKMEKFDKDIQSLGETRSLLSRKISEDSLKKYNTLKKVFKDSVIVKAVDAVCYGCHLSIPPQNYNELVKEKSTQLCPHCSRIIYWGEDDKL